MFQYNPIIKENYSKQLLQTQPFGFKLNGFYVKPQYLQSAKQFIQKFTEGFFFALGYMVTCSITQTENEISL